MQFLNAHFCLYKTTRSRTSRSCAVIESKSSFALFNLLSVIPVVIFFPRFFLVAVYFFVSILRALPNGTSTSLKSLSISQSVGRADFFGNGPIPSVK